MNYADKQNFKSAILSGKILKIGVFVTCLFSFLISNAQNSKVAAAIDSTEIKIGEQVTYEILVETQPDNLVVFPEGDTFSPLELVESLAPDTLKEQSKYRLRKEYFLTQFDSGKYVIPQQKVLIGNKEYLTDSMRVEVNNVVVDTTKQKLYPIKPSVEVSGGFHIPSWVWWLLGILALGALTAFLIIKRKAKKDAEPELPPYEQAMTELKSLDESHLLEDRQTKEYYSRLSFSARKYLDRKIYDRGLESTTKELITYLRLQKDAGKLNLDEATIANFKKILERADLAKFANSRPDVITAKSDRSNTEELINSFRDSVPEPTQEELMRNETYLAAQAKKRKRRRIIIGVLIGVAVIVVGVTALIATKGFTYVKDTYLGHPTKELLEGEWIRSTYGNSPVAITTPQVLVRGDLEMPNEAKEMLMGNETFTYGSLLSNFYVTLSTVQFQKNVEFDLDKAVDGIYSNLEKQGASNIVMKKEEFSTINGAKGIKVFGSLTAENPVTGKSIPNEYLILNFGENKGYQQIMVIYNDDDKYAEEIAQRIMNSVELKKLEN